MISNKNSIKFTFNKTDKKLFSTEQKDDFKEIEKYYSKLHARLEEKICISDNGTHKQWITERVKLHINTSIIRLLYLTEAFCNSAKHFNSVATGSLIKSMLEIPLHIGFLAWVLSEEKKFKDIRKQLIKIAFGLRDKKTSMTIQSKVTRRELCEKTDAVMKKSFKKQSDFFKWLYKESNVIGHHSFEGREMLCGIMDKYGCWQAKDRKESFQFYSNNIFQFFFYCNSILGLTDILLNATEHYLKQLPDYFEDR